MNIHYRPFIRQAVPINTEIEGYVPIYSSFVPRSPEIPQEEIQEEVEDTNPISKSDGEGVKIETPKIQVRTPKVKTSEEKMFANKEEFKTTMLSLYEKILKEKGLNPAFAKSLFGQDKLESSASGNKRTGRYNLGGVKETRKGKGTTTRTREVIDGKDVYINDSFRDFDSLEEYARYKVNLLNNKRYQAFSGDVSEFASRVHKGGYATDPKYTEVLNKVIASSRNGGILKFEKGSNKESLKNWYAERPTQLSNNFSEATGVYIPAQLARLYLNKNIDSATVKVDPESLPENVRGVYSSFPHEINVDSNDPIVVTHELTHASHNVPAENKIAKIIEEMGGDIYELGNGADAYLDDPSEIYARLMEMRKLLNIDPKKHWTPKDIKDLKSQYRNKSHLFSTWIGENGPEWLTHTLNNDTVIKTEPAVQGKLQDTKVIHEYDRKNDEDLLTRYKDEFIQRIFNEVADSDSKDLTRIARNGMKYRNKETRQFIRNTNGAVNYAKRNNQSYPEFWDRLRSADPTKIMDWTDPSKHNTHLMEYGESDGRNIVYPAVQEVNGKLIDFTRPPYHNFAAQDNAVETGNYVTAPNKRVAKDFANNYKAYTEYFPAFKSEYAVETTPQPTISDLANFTAAYETFQPLTYKLKNEETEEMQELVGYGMADKDLVEKYRNVPMKKAEAQRLLKERLARIHNDLTKSIPNFKNLPMNVQLAITDIAYNGRDVNEILKHSPNLLKMINDGVVDPEELIIEMDHSKTHDSWLGDRSAARRAMALGEFNWNHENVDKYGRHLDPNKPVGKQDWKSGMYLGNY